MRNYTDEQIRNIIVTHIAEYDQHELRFIIAYCIGYFEVITSQIWDVIRGLIFEGIIKD